MALLALGVWNPHLPGRSRALDAVVVFDITQSMAVRDRVLVDARGASQSVTRLAFAQRRLDEALAALPCGSRIGLGVFTGYRSFVLLAPVEVCSGYRELRSSIAGVGFHMAWAGNSEVAKGLYAGLRAVDEAPGRPALVFITDGHESPPVNPRFRPPFKGTSAPVAGLVVGVGGDEAAPIPRLDGQGRPVGLWRAGDVMQVDPRSLGRSGTSSGGEAMNDDEAPGQALSMLGATPGREHLSALRGDYLRLLAEETRLQYLRLDSSAGLATALLDGAMTHTVPGEVAGRPLLAGLALLLLVAVYLPGSVVRAVTAGLRRAPAGSPWRRGRGGRLG